MLKTSLSQHHSPAHLFCQHLQLNIGGGLAPAQVEDEASSCQGPYLQLQAYIGQFGPGELCGEGR